MSVIVVWGKQGVGVKVCHRGHGGHGTQQIIDGHTVQNVPQYELGQYVVDAW